MDNRRFPPEGILREIRRQLDFCINAFSICRNFFFRLHKLERGNRSANSLRSSANHDDCGGPLYGRKTGDFGVVGLIHRHFWSDLFTISRDHRPAPSSDRFLWPPPESPGAFTLSEAAAPVILSASLRTIFCARCPWSSVSFCFGYRRWP